MSRVLAFAVALICVAPAYAQTRYSAHVEDFPLPPGFERIFEYAPYSGEAGRIVVMDGLGAGSPASVRAFYEAALPPLGWSFSPGDEGLVFQRGRQRLTLIIEPAQGGTHLLATFVERPSPSD
ncbi:MAG: hypothetical protein AB7O98_02625 [Hyphomonadaceae bacterium]